MHAHLTHGLANAHIDDLQRIAAATHAATASAQPRRLPRLKLRARSLGGRSVRPVLRRA